ncbi:MAG: C-GCAxxG-C-C family protein [Deltaproteobacteria bacterium]|jgi:hypothetical protein|nr:C-GCAxxG-C-C family protein [Deltaproteobacteria bacterium]
MDEDTRMDILELAGQGYTCAQIVVILGLRVMGRENPDLIRSLSGLAMGASSGSLCGALTGGLCLISLHVGKGLEDERPVLGHRLPLQALVGWFVKEELKGQIAPTCKAIFDSYGAAFNLETSAPTAQCADLVGDTYIKALSLITEHGLDPTLGRDES